MFDPNAVYVKHDDGFHPVAKCENFHDAHAIACFFALRDRGEYEYMWTGPDGKTWKTDSAHPMDCTAREIRF